MKDGKEKGRRKVMFKRERKNIRRRGQEKSTWEIKRKKMALAEKKNVSERGR